VVRERVVSEGAAQHGARYKSVNNKHKPCDASSSTSSPSTSRPAQRQEKPVSKAREAIRSKREADLAPKTWRQFDEDFDASPVKPVNKRILLQKKEAPTGSPYHERGSVIRVDGRGDTGYQAQRFQRFEAMTKREVTDLKKSLGILGA